MIDIKLIRENPEIVRKNLKERGNKGKPALVDELLKLDKTWRANLEKVNGLKHKRNVLTKEIAELKKAGKNTDKKLKEVKEIPLEIKKLEENVEKLKEKRDKIHKSLPNIIHESVPLGVGDENNVEIKKIGKPPMFDFKAKNHLELLIHLKLIDSERAAKVSGTGFFYNKEELAILDMALQRFAIDFLRKRGYILVNPPYMLRRKPYEGVVDLEDFEEVMYKIENEDLYMIATAEHPLVSQFMNDTITEKDLPIKLVGISPSFRKEIGTHGKYTKGLFRMHQFHKVEQVILCKPGDSWKFHQELQKNCEDLYKELGLAIRVVNTCAGELSGIASKRLDTEVWMADGKYREVGSNSNCLDYQARSLNIKFREGEGKSPKDFVHTLNNTALATSRVMIGVIEQNQQKDGTIKIPKVLRPYMNKKKFIGK